MRAIWCIGLWLGILLGGCDKEEYFFSLSRQSLVFEWKGGVAKEVTVTSNSPWEVAVLPAWLSLQAKEGDNSTVLSFTAEPNEGDSSRFCRVEFHTEGKEEILVITQLSQEELAFWEDTLRVGFTPTDTVAKIEANVIYSVNVAEDWVQVAEGNTNEFELKSASAEEYIRIEVNENTSRETRIATVVISNPEYNLRDTLTVIQEGNPQEYYADGTCVQWQQADYPEGANLVFMGDGFTWENLTVGGYYETCLKKAVEHFFSIEPYKTYRNCFNVYMVAAVSEEAGVGNSNQPGKIRNKFESVYGMGTAITCNNDLVFKYARKIENLPEGKPLTVVLVLNDDKYAGTAVLYADGNSIALCPMSTEDAPNDFEGIVHHEAGGHAFGFLCDEYVYYQQPIPANRKQEVLAWQELGFQMNLDFTGNASTVLWKDFIGQTGYEEAGIYEGGFEYQYGVWRSEENSCMNNNIPYYNVQSRWSIVQRIMQLSGQTCSIEEFMARDLAVPPAIVSKACVTQEFVPLGKPQWIFEPSE